MNGEWTPLTWAFEQLTLVVKSSGSKPRLPEFKPQVKICDLEQANWPIHTPVSSLAKWVLLWELNEMIHVKHSAEHLAQSKGSLNGILIRINFTASE